MMKLDEVPARRVSSMAIDIGSLLGMSRGLLACDGFVGW
jgi:hypothetical protein